MIIENIKHTRSHRRFTEKKIKEEEILEMLEGDFLPQLKMLKF